jgi:carboxymethylenebutenolidase
MGEMIELKAADGAKIGAYKAVPDGDPKGGIVVVQEIFGVNHHIRAVTDRFAAEGYVGLAPALFDRAEKGVELAYDEAGTSKGFALARKIPMDQHFLSIEAAIEALAATGPIGIVGFCLGGTLAYAAATRSEFLSAAVGYYGGMIAGMTGAELNCQVELHFGEQDQHIPLSDVDKIRTAHPAMPIYTYPAGHGFNCDERGSYDKPSADLAWTRTLAFLDREMASPSKS